MIGSLAVSLAACSSFGANGPSSGSILDSANKPLANASISVVPLTEDVARQLVAGERRSRFSKLFTETEVSGALIGNGDVLEITLWEAPPAVLFGSAPTGLLSSSVASSQSLSQPGQVVDANGKISVPFAGSLQATGRTPAEIERDIVARLRGKAHQHQASVRVVRNQATNASVVGDVANSGRIPLSPKGERLLDVLVSAGGTRNAVSKTVIQLSRGNRVASMPLEAIIEDPLQNVVIQPDDVVTVYYQPYSYGKLKRPSVGGNGPATLRGSDASIIRLPCTIKLPTKFERTLPPPQSGQPNTAIECCRADPPP